MFLHIYLLLVCNVKTSVTLLKILVCCNSGMLSATAFWKHFSCVLANWMLYISPFLSCSETQAVVTFLTPDVYSTNSFLHHCKYLPDSLHLLQIVLMLGRGGGEGGMKDFCWLFHYTAQISFCWNKWRLCWKGLSSFALLHFPVSLIPPGWQLLGSLCSLGQHGEGFWERSYCRVALGMRDELPTLCKLAWTKQNESLTPEMVVVCLARQPL